MASSSSSSTSSSYNWVYDVFPSFCGEDVRINFLSHFLKELDRKLITAFKDNEIERSQSLDPELKQAIRTSRIAVVVFSDKYPSSSWCMDEFMEIMKCRKKSGQLVIPISYGLDPSHVRKQTGKFGEAFANTCERKTEKETKLWRESLTEVANLAGYHSHNWHSEAKMIEAIANDVLSKLNITPPKDFEEFVGMENHMAEMSVLLDVESEEVRMVGIWGTSGIGKTSIARALYSRLSHCFQGTIFIDKAFVSRSTKIYKNSNPDDYNKKLHLLRSFLSKVLDKKDIKIDCLSAMEGRLKNKKVLIFIDDLDDQMVLDTLVGQIHWFGRGSRIIVVTKDKHFLRAHGIHYIYEVCLPSKELALEMLCISAFKKNFPPEDMRELASEVAFLAGNLPLGLKVLGSHLRGRNKEDWIDMLPRLHNTLDGEIVKTLRVSYDGLNNKKDQAIFRHIACIFNGEKLNDIKLLLADSDLDVNIGLRNLVDKSLIHVRDGIVEMHSLLEDLGKEIVRAQSNEPGEREFIMDSKDICDLFEDNIGTKKVLGIALNMDEIDGLHIHENVFKGMHNLFFLKLYTMGRYQNNQVGWHLPEGFDYLPSKLRLLRFDGYPMRCMPSTFRPESFVKLQMKGSKLEKLWEGVHILKGLEEINLTGSKNLKEIPDLSMATNLNRVYLNDCSNLIELPSSIQYLNKLEFLIMSRCTNLETLPTGINLQSLKRLDLEKCSKLKSFPDISTNISELILGDTCIEELPFNLRLENLLLLAIWRMKSEKLWERVQPLKPLTTMLPPTLERLFLSDIPSLVELPPFIQNFHKLDYLEIKNCINLETLPNGINFRFLYCLELTGCSRLKTFPDLSTNIERLSLNRTGIKEVPRWIDKFSELKYLNMKKCNSLVRVSLNIYKLHLLADFSDCKALIEATWNGGQNEVENVHSRLPVLEEDSSSSCEHNFTFRFFNLDPEALLNNRSIIFVSMQLSSEEVPSYFTHQTTGCSLTNIYLDQTSLTQPFLRLRIGVVVFLKSKSSHESDIQIHIKCRFKSKFGNRFDSLGHIYRFTTFKKDGNLFVLDCRIPLRKNNVHRSYDHMDMEICIDDTTFTLKGWGVRILEDFSSLGNNNVETEIIRKRMRAPLDGGSTRCSGSTRFHHGSSSRPGPLRRLLIPRSYLCGRGFSTRLLYSRLLHQMQSADSFPSRCASLWPTSPPGDAAQEVKRKRRRV